MEVNYEFRDCKGVKRSWIVYFITVRIINNIQRFVVIGQNVIVNPTSESYTERLDDNYISAPTTDELPMQISKVFYPKGEGSYGYDVKYGNLKYFQDKKLQNALAKMWLWVIEKEY